MVLSKYQQQHKFSLNFNLQSNTDQSINSIPNLLNPGFSIVLYFYIQQYNDPQSVSNEYYDNILRGQFLFRNTLYNNINNVNNIVPSLMVQNQLLSQTYNI